MGLPTHLFTTMVTEFSGQIPVGSATDTSGAFAFSANNFYQPFLLSNYATGANKIDNSATSGLTALYTSTSTNMKYNGTTATANYYGTYRIWRSRIKLVINQQSAVDTQMWTTNVFPYAEYISNVYPLNPPSVATMPHSKQLMSSNGGGTLKINNSVYIPEVIGYSKLQYGTVLPTTLTGNSTTQIDDVIWLVQWFNLSNAVTAGIIFVTLTLECDIEFQTPLNPVL
jgi:hypothetical protein